MTRILTIIALLSATPVAAEGKSSQNWALEK